MSQFPWMSPYVAFDNNPIFYTDPYGLAATEGETGPPEPTGLEGEGTEAQGLDKEGNLANYEYTCGDGRKEDESWVRKLDDVAVKPNESNSNNTNITVKAQRTIGQATVGTIDGEASTTSIITKGGPGFEQTIDLKTGDSRSIGFSTPSGTKVSFSKSGDIKVGGEFIKTGSTKDGRLIIEFSLGANTKGNLTLKIDTEQINDDVDRGIQYFNKIVNKSIENMGKLSGAILSYPGLVVLGL